MSMSNEEQGQVNTFYKPNKEDSKPSFKVNMFKETPQSKMSNIYKRDIYL